MLIQALTLFALAAVVLVVKAAALFSKMPAAGRPAFEGGDARNTDPSLSYSR